MWGNSFSIRGGRGIGLCFMINGGRGWVGLRLILAGFRFSGISGFALELAYGGGMSCIEIWQCKLCFMRILYASIYPVPKEQTKRKR